MGLYTRYAFGESFFFFKLIYIWLDLLQGSYTPFPSPPCITWKLPHCPYSVFLFVSLLLLYTDVCNVNIVHRKVTKLLMWIGLTVSHTKMWLVIILMLILFSRGLFLDESFIMSVMESLGKLISQKTTLFLYYSNICVCCIL